MNNFKKYLVDLIPVLAKYIHVNRGLDFIKEEADAEHKDYVMGASNNINWQVIKEDGNWTKDLPENERQNIHFETMNCTAFSLLNVIEILAKVKFGETWNLSDRYLGAMAGTTPNGNSMKKVLETVRKYGCVNEKDYPWANSWGEYYQRPNQALLDKGLAWTKQYTIGYEKVWGNDNAMKEAIKFSPLYVGLYAWYRQGGVYKSVGNANHASVLAQMPPKIDYDSYDPYIKHLAEDFKIPYVYRIYLEKKDLEYNQIEIKKLIARGFKYILRALGNGEIYELKDSGLRQLTADEARDFGIRTLEKSKELIGINEGLYSRLLK